MIHSFFKTKPLNKFPVKMYLIFMICLLSLNIKAQSKIDDNSNIRWSVYANFGAVVYLPKTNENKLMRVPTELSQYYGLSINAEYKKISFETGIQNFAFPVSMSATDTYINNKVTSGPLGHYSSFNNPWTSFYKIPIQFGYRIQLRNPHLLFVPYLSIGGLVSTSKYFYLSSDGMWGTSIYSQNGATDTVRSKTFVGLERTKKAVVFGEIGAQLKYSIKKYAFRVNVVYFQTLKKWHTNYASYDRTSVLYGNYNLKETYSKNDKAFTLGISIARYLN
jgi:hypothetical protein